MTYCCWQNARARLRKDGTVRYDVCTAQIKIPTTRTAAGFRRTPRDAAVTETEFRIRFCCVRSKLAAIYVLRSVDIQIKLLLKIAPYSRPEMSGVALYTPVVAWLYVDDINWLRSKVRSLRRLFSSQAPSTPSQRVSRPKPSIVLPLSLSSIHATILEVTLTSSSWVKSNPTFDISSRI